jgi:hypothetical protein
MAECAQQFHLALVDSALFRRLQRPDGLEEQFQRAFQSLPGGFGDCRRSGSLITSLAQRDQADGEIATVDGRDIARLQRRQGVRIIPVENMTAIGFQPLDRCKCIADTGRQIGTPDETEIMRGFRRDEKQSDIGRRGAVGNFAFRRFLEIVRRQPVVFRSNESFEEQPRAPRDVFEKHPIAAIQGFLAECPRLAEPYGKLRRQHP